MPATVTGGTAGPAGCDGARITGTAGWPLNRVATRFEPAAQTTPPAFEYIARSTTMGAGGAPSDSTIAPNRRPTASGKSPPAATLRRLSGSSGTVRLAVPPSSNTSVTRADPA